MKAKKILAITLLCALFVLFALGSGDDTSTTVDQGTDSAQAAADENTSLGAYSVEISDCRIAKDYTGAPVVIVTYKYTNNTNDEPTSFYIAFDDAAFQNGVGLNKAYVLDDDADYDEANQSKEIKKGSTIDVEVAYTLNDTETPVEIEVKELFSFDDKTITKTFDING